MAGRREVRKKLAELDAIRGRAKVFTDQIKDLDRQADEAADDHQRTCRPLQEQLSSIEDDIAAALCDRLPVSPDLERARLEIIGQIEQANQTLEETVARIKKARGRIGKQKKEALKGSEPREPLERKLALSPLANPKLLTDEWLSQQDEQWYQSRLKFARRKLSDATSLRDSTRFHNEKSVYQVRIDRWQAEIQHVQQLLAAAMSKTKEIYEELINE